MEAFKAIFLTSSSKGHAGICSDKEARRVRKRHSLGVDRIAENAHPDVGDPILVKLWIGLSEAKEDVIPGLSFNMKKLHLTPTDLRYNFDGKSAHFAWGADLELAKLSTVALLLCTLTDRGEKRGGGNSWA